MRKYVQHCEHLAPEHVTPEQGYRFFANFFNIKHKQKVLEFNLVKLQNRIYQNNDINLLYRFSEVCQKIKILKKCEKICQELIAKYKTYDIMEIIESPKSEHNIHKCERTIFRHRNDFYMYVAYSLYIKGITFQDVAELLEMYS